MSNLPENLRVECRQFLDEMEKLPVKSAAEDAASGLLARMSAGARDHARACKNCEEALENLTAIRSVLEPMAAAMPEAGPWFTTRVMAAIRAKERELEERREGVWGSVRRKAPRLAAFCGLLLVLGWAWAMHVRSVELARGPEMAPVEAVFGTTQNSPFNDDVLLPVRGTQR